MPENPRCLPDFGADVAIWNQERLVSPLAKQPLYPQLIRGWALFPLWFAIEIQSKWECSRHIKVDIKLVYSAIAPSSSDHPHYLYLSNPSK